MGVVPLFYCLHCGRDQAPRFSAACRISRRAAEFAVCRGIHHMPQKYAETVVLADLLIFWWNFSWLILLRWGRQAACVGIVQGYAPFWSSSAASAKNAEQLQNTERWTFIGRVANLHGHSSKRRACAGSNWVLACDARTIASVSCSCPVVHCSSCVVVGCWAFVFEVWYCFVASSPKHVDGHFACSLLGILQQHCAVKTIVMLL